MNSATLATNKNWRTPAVVLICGGLALTIALGTRHSFGLFLQPMTMDLGWNRQTFAFAMALQNLVYGIAQPFTGMIADRFGAARVMVVGTILYALGLLWMSSPASGTDFSLSAGVLIGLALSCSGFSIVFGVVGRAFPPEKRSMALGIAGAAGSLGQFVMLPFGQLLINQIGWHHALMTLALVVLVIAPLSAAMVEDRSAQPSAQSRQSVPEALREAGRHQVWDFHPPASRYAWR